MYNMLSSCKDMQLLKSNGTFYMFPDVSQILKKLNLPNADALSLYCLEKAHLGIMPGTSFGSDHHIRFSFAHKPEKLIEGLSRFLELVNT